MKLHFSLSFWAILFFGAYAVAGFVALIRAAGADVLMPRKVYWEKTTIYIACMLQTIFEMSRSIWDCFHVEHFPLGISDAFLITVFIVFGFSNFGVYDHRGWSLTPHDDGK